MDSEIAGDLSRISTSCASTSYTILRICSEIYLKRNYRIRLRLQSTFNKPMCALVFLPNEETLASSRWSKSMAVNRPICLSRNPLSTWQTSCDVQVPCSRASIPWPCCSEWSSMWTSPGGSHLIGQRRSPLISWSSLAKTRSSLRWRHGTRVALRYLEEVRPPWRTWLYTR